MGEDPELQSRLRALVAYSYGTSGGVDEDEPNPWALRLVLWRAVLGGSVLITGVAAGATATGWLPAPLGLVALLVGGVLFLVGIEGWCRWLRLRNIPSDVLEACAIGPLLRVCFAITMWGEKAATEGNRILTDLFAAGMPLSGPVTIRELPMLHSITDSSLHCTVPLPASQVAALLTPAEAGDPAAVLHPETRMDVPSPPPSQALRTARLQGGRAIAGDGPVGIDPDGHGVFVGGSRSGKSSLAYALLTQLLGDVKK